MKRADCFGSLLTRQQSWSYNLSWAQNRRTWDYGRKNNFVQSSSFFVSSEWSTLKARKNKAHDSTQSYMTIIIINI